MQAKILFLLKFLLLVSILLPLWIFSAAQPYMGFLGQESAVVLRAVGYTIVDTASTDKRLYLQMDAENSVNFEAIFATLNLVVFVSLLLCTPRVPWRRRLGFLVVGLVLLNLFHILFVAVHFWLNFNYTPGSRMFASVQSISEIACLLAPMLLWAVMEAPRLFRPRRPAR